jgi:hypothetical protein
MLEIKITTNKPVPLENIYHKLEEIVLKTTGKRLVNAYVKGNDLYLIIENPIPLAGLLALIAAIGQFLIPLTIAVVGIQVGGAFAESIKNTAYIWVPIVSGAFALFVLLYAKSKGWI